MSISQKYSATARRFTPTWTARTTLNRREKPMIQGIKVVCGRAAVVVMMGAGVGLLGCSSEAFEPEGAGGAKADAGVGAGAGGEAGIGAAGSAGDSGSGGADSGAAGAGGSAGSAGSSGSSGSAGSAGSTGGSENGTQCSGGSACKSGNCVDGVCCNTKCGADCESCVATGSKGTCTPFAQGTDPDGECLGTGAPGSDCIGSCDGKSACSFPSVAKTCGTAVCTGAQSTGYACDGSGSCKAASTSCAPYNCGASACLASCTTDTHCTSGNYCASGKCVPKKTNGQVCGANNQCSSSNCVGGTCCNVASCGAPLSCSTGTCSCDGTVCKAGDSCVLWYKDADGDGHGDAKSTKHGCSSVAPVGYVANKTDCYDANANAKPGQTQFFAQHRGDGSFDYNCDNGATKQYANVTGKSCVDCHAYGNSQCSLPCGLTYLGSTLYSMAYECNGASDGSQCGGPKTQQGFHADVACGASGTLYSCSVNTCSAAEKFVATTAQGCR